MTSAEARKDEMDEIFCPKVSIIIPVYNGANFMREAIDSALSQSYRNVEVIVVNDGSTDNGQTHDIAHTYGDRIRYFVKPNGGVATALNLGIEKMSGEYFSWLSHDDIYLPDKVLTQIKHLQESGKRACILFSDFEVTNLVSRMHYRFNISRETDFGDHLYSSLQLLFKSNVHGCTFLIPRSCFSKFGVFNTDLKTTQDYEFFFRLLRNGYEFLYQPQALIVTRHHKDQDTLRVLDSHIEELNRLYIWAFNLFQDEFKSFSVEQIYLFLMVAKNRGLKQAYAHILREYNYDWTELYRQLRHPSPIQFGQQKQDSLLGKSLRVIRNQGAGRFLAQMIFHVGRWVKGLKRRGSIV